MPPAQTRAATVQKETGIPRRSYNAWRMRHTRKDKGSGKIMFREKGSSMGKRRRAAVKRKSTAISLFPIEHITFSLQKHKAIIPIRMVLVMTVIKTVENE